ncbi:hypothetical protein POTOM_025717 [Populus tomentosa]|uniref:Uncharacterized protein n=1 Tax=Populus tomentosa TaxID=118781 RepID=A0A8X7ZVV5_POPTO|nr:hypothetical protein POTOM_025717 [Populus tomentosa]
MASRLKVAEDLFENMDGKAKLVATELSDETSELQPPASQWQGSKPKKTKSKMKGPKRLSNKQSPQANKASRELTSTQMPQLVIASDNDRATLSVENEETLPSKSITQTSTENQHDAEKDATVTAVDSAKSTSNGELLNEKDLDVPVEHPPPLLKEIAVVNQDHPIDDGQNIKSKEADVPVNIDQEKSQSTVTSSPVNKETSTKVADFKVEPLVNQKKHLENKADSSPVTVQDQLDEAQGLLKAAVSSAQSKEARLARPISKSEVTRIESNMAEALAAKNSEIEALVSSIETTKKQAALSEGNLASIQVAYTFHFR